jgi:hypothetical protein
MTSEAVLATEARTYGAADAVAIGFADAVMAPQEALADFVSRLTSAASTPSIYSEAPVADTDTAAESRAAERARVKAITGHEAARDHSSLASYLAYETDLSAEAAAGILSAAAQDKPQAPAAPAANAFTAAMSKAAAPTVGEGHTDEASEQMSEAQFALQSLGLATGRKITPKK